MINHNEIVGAARFFPNKDKAREDYLEKKCMDINSGTLKIGDAVAFIMGHCAGQQFMSEELTKLQEDNKKLVEVLEMVENNRLMPHQHTDPQLRLYCLAERAREALKDIGEPWHHNNTSPRRVPTYEARLAWKALKDAGEL